MADEVLTRILYVEDDADIRSVAGFALEAVGGFVLAACASGEEALARAPGFAPQLLLLDVMMPGMDGPETLAALREMPGTAVTPAVFMTAKVQLHEVARYRALGAIDVISKPFDPMTLSDEIRAIWARRDGRGTGS
ncbi:response regulator [Inquilinus sp. OTU3971]|uniref:response regulator n=1 Tax=Inquilinus sp. OTU3971 TaxID=3043855 RepID=UPI00313B4D34